MITFKQFLEARKPSYFDMGHADFTVKDRVWIWKNGKLEIDSGFKTHSGNWGISQGIESNWRGRYDAGKGYFAYERERDHHPSHEKKGETITIIPPGDLGQGRFRVPPDLKRALMKKWPLAVMVGYAGARIK